MLLLRSSVLSLFAFALTSFTFAAGPSGEKFAEPKKAGSLRALLIGGGSSHDFEKFFHKTDSETLRHKGFDTAYSEDVDESVALLPQADVLILSTNQPQFGSPKFQEALNAFADAGKGVIVLHPGAWFNWPPATGYNVKFVGGGAKSHDKYGKFTVTVTEPGHPVMKDVPATFDVMDELYQVSFDPAAQTKVLAETSTSAATKKTHASVWIVSHPKAKIVGVALGHDAAVHDLPAFQSILTNAATWVAAGK